MRKSPRQPFSLFYHTPQQLLLRKYNLTIGVKVHPLAEECLILTLGLCVFLQEGLCLFRRVNQHLKATAVDDRHVVIGVLACRKDGCDLLVTDAYCYTVTEYDAVKACLLYTSPSPRD